MAFWNDSVSPYRKSKREEKMRPIVGVVMGSKSDKEIVSGCIELLEKFGISYELKILSAHRSPELAKEYATKAQEKGIEIIIAAAGWAAHLAGFIASHTTVPVIGIPIDSSPLNGIDALLSTVQMPPGIPVATVAIGKGGAKNAAILATQILAIKYPELKAEIEKYREEMRKSYSLEA